MSDSPPRFDADRVVRILEMSDSDLVQLAQAALLSKGHTPAPDAELLELALEARWAAFVRCRDAYREERDEALKARLYDAILKHLHSEMWRGFASEVAR